MYNRLIYNNYCLQTQCSQLSMQNTMLESRIQTLESRIQTLESRIQTLESRIQTLESRIQTLESRIQTLESRIQPIEITTNKSPTYSRKSRNKLPTFSMNQFTPITLPRRQSKNAHIHNEIEQYSSLTEDSDI